MRRSIRLPLCVATAVAAVLGAASVGAVAAPAERVIVSFNPGAAAALRAAVARSGVQVTIDLSEVRALAVSLPAQIRSTLTRSAKDLGTRGRDDKTGFGLVQAKAALDRIASVGCGN